MNDLLDRMKKNPAGDWTIKDIETVCRQHAVACDPPTGGGGHYKVHHHSQPTILTIPFNRPVKPVYIRGLVKFLRAVGASNGAV